MSARRCPATRWRASRPLARSSASTSTRPSPRCSSSGCRGRGFRDDYVDNFVAHYGEFKAFFLRRQGAKLAGLSSSSSPRSTTTRPSASTASSTRPASTRASRRWCMASTAWATLQASRPARKHRPAARGVRAATCTPRWACWRPPPTSRRRSSARWATPSTACPARPETPPAARNLAQFQRSDPGASSRSSSRSPTRPTCSPSTPPSRRPAPGEAGRGSRWWPTRCASWPRSRAPAPARSAPTSRPWPPGSVGRPGDRAPGGGRVRRLVAMLQGYRGLQQQDHRSADHAPRRRYTQNLTDNS